MAVQFTGPRFLVNMVLAYGNVLARTIFFEKIAPEPHYNLKQVRGRLLSRHPRRGSSHLLSLVDIPAVSPPRRSNRGHQRHSYGADGGPIRRNERSCVGSRAFVHRCGCTASASTGIYAQLLERGTLVRLKLGHYPTGKALDLVLPPRVVSWLHICALGKLFQLLALFY